VSRQASSVLGGKRPRAISVPSHLHGKQSKVEDRRSRLPTKPFNALEFRARLRRKTRRSTDQFAMLGGKPVTRVKHLSTAGAIARSAIGACPQGTREPCRWNNASWQDLEGPEPHPTLAGKPVSRINATTTLPKIALTPNPGLPASTRTRQSAAEPCPQALRGVNASRRVSGPLAHTPAT
jgi:hypothetical protein